MGDIPNSEVAPTTRRMVVRGLMSMPLVGIVAAWAGTVRKNARALRPKAVGTSTKTCAVCGSQDHAMLTCPSNPKVI